MKHITQQWIDNQFKRSESAESVKFPIEIWVDILADIQILINNRLQLVKRDL